MPSLKADTIIRNANIITIDPRQPRANALAMLHVRFVAVGGDDAVADLVGPDTSIDCDMLRSILRSIMRYHNYYIFVLLLPTEVKCGIMY